MYLTKLVVQNFRNFSKETFEFAPSINVIYGLNGTGKSNLLEAIAYISRVHSFREVEDRNLIKWGESFFRIEGKLVDERVSYRVRISYELNSSFGEKKKEIHVNQKPVRRISELTRMWPVVALSSRDHQFVDGSPNSRRRYIDRMLSGIDPYYSSCLYRYRKALQQKNSLLRVGQLAQISHWNRKLEELGSYLVNRRREAIDTINRKMKEKMPPLSLKELCLVYNLSLSMDQRSLEDFLEEEVKEGVSLYGPHRDDMTFLIDGKKASVCASEGEKRIILFGLAVAFREILLEVTGSEPALVLDDPLSVLGEDKSRLLLSMCQGQVFISTVRRIPDLEPLIVLEETSLEG